MNATMSALTRRGFRFKKELGQNFLFNHFALTMIADSAGIAPGDVVVEAGAGAGSLTAVLAEKKAKVVAVELDRVLIPFLRERFGDNPDVRVVHGDIMKMDIDALAINEFPAASYKICSNLPYNISTAFVTRVFRELKNAEAGAILLQKEVADKITAHPGQEGYGMLSLAASWYGEAKQDFEIEPDYFTPPPPVMSSVVSFRGIQKPCDVSEKDLWFIIRTMFNQRRKTVLNIVKSMKDFTPVGGLDWSRTLTNAGIDHQKRPETLSLKDFIIITGLTRGERIADV